LVGLTMIGIGNGKDRVKMRNAYKVLVSKPKLGSLFQLGDNIKVCIRELGCEVIDCFHLIQHKAL
jgi:hypothetical protein